VWTKNFKTSPAEEDDVEMTGDWEGWGEPSRDEDDFEKQMCLVNESDKNLRFRFYYLRLTIFSSKFWRIVSPEITVLLPLSLTDVQLILFCLSLNDDMRTK
jgi:hypothetical protein